MQAQAHIACHIYMWFTDGVTLMMMAIPDDVGDEEEEQEDDQKEEARVRKTMFLHPNEVILDNHASTRTSPIL